MIDEIFNKHKKTYNQLIKLFQEENSKINLSSFNDDESILNKHILDSLNIFQFPFVNEIMEKEKILTFADIGTGGGFPGLALAIALPSCEFTLIDSIGKKCKAVESMANSLKLTNVKVINKRAEELTTKYNVIVSRAVAEFTKIYSWSYNLSNIDTRMYFYKSPKEDITGYSDKIEYKVGDDERIIYEFKIA